MADKWEVTSLKPAGKITISGTYVVNPEPMPLHAQVAKALGWTGLQDRGDGLWIGVQPETGLTVEVPPYGRTWCSTGGLVSKFDISLKRDQQDRLKWMAYALGQTGGGQKWSDDPCEAIARVVVEIHRSHVRLATAVAEQHAEALRNPQPVTENYAAQSRKKEQ